MNNSHYFSKKRVVLPTPEEIVYTVKNMRLWEKIIFFFLAASFLFSFLTIIWKANDNYFLTEVPIDKGALTEGVIGTPRFINPLLAISDADRDMVALIYSGLTRANNQGDLIPDLTEKFTISEDGLVYTFILKPNLVWHDGTPVTSDDVVFTIEKTKDNLIKSPKRGGWEGIEVEKIDDLSLKFILQKPYAPFLENTTIGILPKHLWSDLSSEQMSSSNLNTYPVGTGPYKVGKINRNSSGIITSYELAANKKFNLGKPHIQELTLRFYQSEEGLINAYQKGEIESVNAITPQVLEKIKNNGVIKTLSLPRVFGVFLNQNNAKIFAQKEVRQALNMSVDRKKIISEVLLGFGTELFHPLPPGTLGAITEREDNIPSIDEAKVILEKNGWKLNKEGVLEKTEKKEVSQLSFSISTSDAPELKQTTELLKEMWGEIGVKVDVKVFEIGDLNQNVIRPRKYDSLLFGEIVSREPDPFAFWHSSQRNDPGLNIALYANIKADKILEETRTLSDNIKRGEKYEEFQEEVANDIPAIFLFSPKFIYLIPSSLKGTEQMQSVAVPSERFSMTHNWYKETDKVWKIFAN